MHGTFRDKLQQELLDRREKNPRYSLRAFATFLGADHSTLSQILRAKRPVPAAQIRKWSKKLGLEAEEAAAYIIAEQMPDAATVERENQLRHWTAEAMAILRQPSHWEIIRLSHHPTFQPDCRWIANQIGVTVDEINIAFSRLLRLGLLSTTASGNWIDRHDPPLTNARDFRRIALTRVRQKAAEARVKLPAVLRSR
jgi:transcriptional regulator with XRE-family HTH domain